MARADQLRAALAEMDERRAALAAELAQLEAASAWASDFIASLDDDQGRAVLAALHARFDPQ